MRNSRADSMSDPWVSVEKLGKVEEVAVVVEFELGTSKEESFDDDGSLAKSGLRSFRHHRLGRKDQGRSVPWYQVRFENRRPRSQESRREKNTRPRFSLDARSQMNLDRSLKTTGRRGLDATATETSRESSKRNRLS